MGSDHAGVPDLRRDIMKRWLQVEVEAPSASVPALEEALEAHGALAITLGDPGGPPVLEPAPGTSPLWATARVTAIFDPDVPPGPIADSIRGIIGPEAPTPLISLLQERNWIAEWQATLAPARFGDRLWICPSGHACPDRAARVVELEPGLAFGTGSHATTALCLEWLAGLELHALAVLDYGCGSGILAVAGLVLGARSATAVDIDPQALQATRTNAAHNRCADRLRVCTPDEAAGDQAFDIIVANILSGTLVELAPRLASLCHSGTRVGMSGILAAQAEDVRNGCRTWFDLEIAEERDGWTLLVGGPVKTGAP